MKRELAIEFSRVTEAAALAGYKWLGRGDKNTADGAAVNAMRIMLNLINIDGTIVIGEGEIDEAPMLYLGEMRTLVGDEKVAALRQLFFFNKQLSGGEDNPLWRTVVLREGQLVRRTCCQRYRLPDVQQCGDCTLK